MKPDAERWDLQCILRRENYQAQNLSHQLWKQCVINNKEEMPRAAQVVQSDWAITLRWERLALLHKESLCGQNGGQTSQTLLKRRNYNLKCEVVFNQELLQKMRSPVKQREVVIELTILFCRI